MYEERKKKTLKDWIGLGTLLSIRVSAVILFVYVYSSVLIDIFTN